MPAERPQPRHTTALAFLAFMLAAIPASAQTGVFCEVPEVPACLFDRETTKSDGGVAYCDAQMTAHYSKMFRATLCLMQKQKDAQHQMEVRQGYWNCLKTTRDELKCAGLR